MKKIILGFVATAAVMAAACTPALADVVRPAGQTTGQPVASVSNTGSAQGQAHRSTTGTTNKETHDGFREIW